MLASELSHRVKNTLAIVQALAWQTTGKSVEEFRDKFSGRLRAPAEAHTLLVDSDWSSVELKALLERALSAYRVDDAPRVQLDGVSVAVAPGRALGLRMVVHELATNAVKYGALSNAEKWDRTVLKRPDDVIEMPEFGLRCHVADLYRGTELDPEWAEQA